MPIVALIIIFLSPIAIAEECVVKGHFSLWVTEYCLSENKTRDIWDEKVKHCDIEENAWYPDTSCESKIDLKRRWCKLNSQSPEDVHQIEKCVNDPSNIPEFVKNGGIRL